MAALQKRKHVGSSPTDAPFRVRPATAADVPALEPIERQCFADPWSVASFREALSSSWSFGLVAERNGEVVGYLVARDAAGSGEVLNLAVAPEHRRRRVARTLLIEALEVLALRGSDEVFLEVRESNAAAQALYGSLGFRPVGQRTSYYRTPREDALVLRLGLKSRA